MKRHSIVFFYLFLALLGTGLTKVQAQTYASVTAVPTNKWDFTVVDLNFNPVTTYAPNTSYYLFLRLNAGVVVNDLVAYIIQDGDGWYELASQRPQSFFTGKDATTTQNRGAYFRFTTVEIDDFSGAFFKVRLSNTGATQGQPAGSAPKSKLFQ